uniref:Uncharacterized protein n=1 Tax=Romanomermis culicivorax TaxID=13658 RepID=A0A915IU59_ROMCU
MEKLWNWNPLQYGFNLVKNRRNSSTEATSQMYDINSNGVKDCNEHRCNISELYSSNKSPFRKKQTSLCLPLNNNEHKDQNLDQGAGQSDDGTTKLTEFQRKAVRDAWHSASIKRGHAGLWIFQRLFTLYPELKVIFRVDDNIPIDQLFKDETLIG